MIESVRVCKKIKKNIFKTSLKLEKNLNPSKETTTYYQNNNKKLIKNLDFKKKEFKFKKSNLRFINTSKLA